MNTYVEILLEEWVQCSPLHSIIQEGELIYPAAILRAALFCCVYKKGW